MRPACPVTPDGRYFVVRGRLWRTSNPALSDDAPDFNRRMAANTPYAEWYAASAPGGASA